jgi:hypothetical protein
VRLRDAGDDYDDVYYVFDYIIFHDYDFLDFDDNEGDYYDHVHDNFNDDYSSRHSSPDP